MDGQMSASEALDFEQALSTRDRARLSGESRLEAALCDSLSNGPCCPGALWEGLRSQMQQPAARKPGRMAYFLSRGLIIAAATTAIVLGAPYYERLLNQWGTGQPESPVAISETTREAFAEGLAAQASLAEAQRFLQSHNINLRLSSAAGGNGGHMHNVEFLGVCRGRCPEGGLYELRFWCCGKPAKVLVARRGSSGEEVLRDAFACGEATEREISQEYVTALVGGHGSTDLLNVVQPMRGNLT